MDDLEVRVQELEKENEYLKSLLDQAGIAHDFQTYLKRLEIVAEPETVDKAQGSDVVAGSGDQGARILPCIISTKHAQYFFLFFRGREDVYALRAVNKKTGRAGYYPQCHNFWRRGVCPKADRQKVQCKDCENRAWIKLKSEQIEAHLRGDRPDGSDVIGIYPLFPDGTCRFLVFDFDNHGTGADAKDGVNEDDRWVEEVNALQEICRRNDIPFLAERSRSGRGAHVWIFFGEPIEAGTARRFGFALLEKGAESVNLKSFRFYDRMLPAQDTLPDGGLGNLIALPLQGQALKNGNSAFVDEKWNAFPDQWNALLQTKRLSKRDIEFRLKEWSYPLVEKGQSETDTAKDVKPWERQREFHREDVTGSMHIVLSNQIYIDASNIKPRLQNQIRRMAAISNPIFFKNNAIGFSNYKNSRFIYLGEDDSGYVCIPRGLFEQLKEKCEKAGIPCRIEDQRSNGIPVKAVFTGELRENQIKAASRMMDYDCGILSAATAFGKTVVCSNLIAQRKTSTLILLESSALIEQWEKALNEFLSIDEELPTYQTPSGRTKTRKSLIGVIHGAKDTSTGIIDIAMVGSLCKKGEYHPRLRSYGMCIVDECHHAAADTVRNVLQEINAQYVYGVTATPFRGDGLEKINEMLLGPIRFQFTAKEKAAEQGIAHVVVPRFTRAVSPYGREKLHVNDAYEILRGSEVRNEQITADIQGCVENGRTPVVLTKYTDHAALLYERVKGLADRVFLLVGTKSKKEQHAIREEMDAVRPDESMVLIATGQLIGEGFDYPRLDTLFIAMPVSWKGIVEQYAGRLNRDYPGKKRVEIYDYIDAHIPVFDQMYAKRLKAYKRIGYHLLTEDNSGKQERNAIFDCDTYLNAYEQDLKEATKSIVISSPTLGRNKVVRLLKIIQDRQERGVKVVIVTWHPDAYMYGRDEHRHELLDMLREAGCIIHLARESCEHFAIIDGEIVWYGSMNLLSKEDVEDNLMRVVSADIAAELMEMTFGKERELIEIGL